MVKSLRGLSHGGLGKKKLGCVLERNANSKQWTSHGANQKKRYYSPKDAIFCVNNFQYHRVRRTFSRVLEDYIFIASQRPRCRTTRGRAQASQDILSYSVWLESRVEKKIFLLIVVK